MQEKSAQLKYEKTERAGGCDRTGEGTRLKCERQLENKLLGDFWYAANSSRVTRTRQNNVHIDVRTGSSSGYKAWSLQQE